MNSFTQKAGVRVLERLDEKDLEIDRILQERSKVSDGLRRISGVQQVYSSEANFLLFRDTF